MSRLPKTRAGRALLDAQGRLGYEAYDSPRFMTGYDFVDWNEAILAIEDEASCLVAVPDLGDVQLKAGGKPETTKRLDSHT